MKKSVIICWWLYKDYIFSVLLLQLHSFLYLLCIWCQLHVSNKLWQEQHFVKHMIIWRVLLHRLNNTYNNTVSCKFATDLIVFFRCYVASRRAGIISTCSGNVVMSGDSVWSKFHINWQFFLLLCKPVFKNGIKWISQITTSCWEQPHNHILTASVVLLLTHAAKSSTWTQTHTAPHCQFSAELGQPIHAYPCIRFR